MITSAQRVAPADKVNTMLGPPTPQRSSPTRRASIIDQYLAHDFQDDLIGRPEEKHSAHGHSLMHRTKSLLHRGKTASLKQHHPKYLKEGNAKKLTSHMKWVDKTMALSEETLTISDADNRTDYIPLHEITEVSVARLEQG
eukprot:1059193-Rhodomonas_salina.3